jgi:biopolymer transport protein ExbD
MVDILFLLLIFFMTASAMREEERSIDVSLQQTGSGQAGGSVTPVIISVTADNEIFIGEQSYSIDGLRGALDAIAATTPNEAIVIRGDKQSDLGTTEKILDIAYAVGMTNVRLATTNKDGG